MRKSPGTTNEATTAGMCGYNDGDNGNPGGGYAVGGNDAIGNNGAVNFAADNPTISPACCVDHPVTS